MPKALQESTVKQALDHQKNIFRNAKSKETRQAAVTEIVGLANGKAECNVSGGRNVERAGFFMVMNLSAANDVETAEMLARGLHDIMASKENKFVTKKNIGEAIDGLIDAVNLQSLQQPVRQVIATELAAMAVNPSVKEKIGGARTDVIASALLPSFNTEANQVIEDAANTLDAQTVLMPQALGTWLRVMASGVPTQPIETAEARVCTVELLGSKDMFSFPQDDILQAQVNDMGTQYANTKEDITGVSTRLAEALYNVGFKYELVAA